MNWHDLLGFCVLGALVTTIGSLVAIILKDFFLARSIETWKARQQLRQIYLKLRDPLLLATIDLVNRMIEIAFESPANFLEKSLLNVNPSRMIANTADDQYYLRYKFVSTLYRLCVWFALSRDVSRRSGIRSRRGYADARAPTGHFESRHSAVLWRWQATVGTCGPDPAEFRLQRPDEA